MLTTLFSRIPWGPISFFLALCVSLHLAPVFLLTVLTGLLVGICLLELLKFHLWLGSKTETEGRTNVSRPKVSIHLAICNEPPSMVISTISGILAQDYPDIEIIVVDNNTGDRALWQPVFDFCQGRPEIRFFHLGQWPFYKSGALNFARKVTHREAEFIFVLDADYQLVTNAVSLAVANMARPGIALVQFPQAYDCHDEKYRSIMDEFDHFFDYYCFKADSCKGALATGTLSLIRIDSLDRVGGWPINSVTEDAELGARLQVAGHDIKYVHRKIGKGIAPLSQIDFVKQRKRWIYGNAQTLMNYTMRPWRNFGKWLSGVSQLTAWANLLGLPLLVLFASLVLSFLYGEPPLVALSLSYTAIWIFAVSKFLQIRMAQDRTNLSAFRTFLIHFATLDIGAFHWWPALLGRGRPFVRTDKTGRASGYRVNMLYPLLHLMVLLVIWDAASIFIATSASTFLSLHLMSLRLDYLVRSGKGSGITFNLRLYP